MTTPHDAEGEVERIDAYHVRVATVPETGCWLWLGPIDNKGYGQVSINGRTYRAHRASWEQANGPIPKGMVIDHLCRVRCCVNPDHLRVVTTAMNNTQNSLSPTAKNLAKKACPKCGGEYRVDARGKRYCAPCQDKFKREWDKLHRQHVLDVARNLRARKRREDPVYAERVRRRRRERHLREQATRLAALPATPSREGDDR